MSDSYPTLRNQPDVRDLLAERDALAERNAKLRRIVTAFVRKTAGVVDDWNERHPAVPHPLTATVKEAQESLAALQSEGSGNER